MLSTEGTVGHCSRQWGRGVSALFVDFGAREAKTTGATRIGQAKTERLAIALVTATITSPHCHEE